MYDYPTQITAFISDNFKPSTPEEANVKITNKELLQLLFNSFPIGCISDYELNDILKNLGYQPFTYVEEKTEDGNTKKELTIGWCMSSSLNFTITPPT